MRGIVAAGAGRACAKRARSLLILLAAGFASLPLAPLWGQEPLSLPQAVETALRSHPAVEAAQAGKDESEAGIRMARAGYRPRVDFSESWQRSNNPVFVFGSLLNQGQFGESNFAISSLNNPDPLNNFQSRFSVQQVLFDSWRTKRAVRAAHLGSEMAAEEQRSTGSDVVLGVVRTYFGALLAAENLRVAENSLKSAQADLERAESVFQAGMTTEADVLSVRVHLSSVEQERIRAEQDAQVALAALNDALGVPLDSDYRLTTPLRALDATIAPVAEYEQRAIESHPALRRAELGRVLAETQVDVAKTALWPQVTAHGIFEADRQGFASRGNSNWLTGVSLEWNVWDGSRSRAQIAAARSAEVRNAALERQAGSAVLLGVRRAWGDWRSSTERVGVAAGAVAAAEASHEIIRNRYEAGLTTVTELIRSDTALRVARFQHLGAQYEQRVSAAALDHAAGVLTPQSVAVR
ncbi:MAG: TolC family protein [Bryobacterales bacterium]